MYISFPNHAVDKDLCLGEIQSGLGFVQLGTRLFCHQTLLQGRSQEASSVIATPVYVASQHLSAHRFFLPGLTVYSQKTQVVVDL